MNLKFVIKHLTQVYLYIWYRLIVFLGVMLIIIFFTERGFYPDYIGPFLAFGLLILVIKHSFVFKSGRIEVK